MQRATPLEAGLELQRLWNLPFLSVGSTILNERGILGNPGSLPNNYIFGHGLEVTFWIQFRRNDTDKPPTEEEIKRFFDKVKSFDIYLFFLDRTRQKIPQPGPRITLNDLELTDHISQVESSVPPSRDTSLQSFDELWNTKIDESNGVDTTVTRFLDAQLAVENLELDVEITAAIKSTLDRVFSSEIGNNASPFQIPSVLGALQVIKGINKILVDRLQNDFATPLQNAKDSLRGDEKTRNNLGIMNDAFAIWNMRLEHLEFYIAELKKVKNALDGLGMAEGNKKSLNSIVENLEKEIMSLEQERLLNTLYIDSNKKAANAAVINYVLEKILIEYNNPPSSTNK
jgi:hypothetical protein